MNSIIRSKELTKLALIRTYSRSKYYALVNNLDELKEVANFSKEKNLELIVLGNGSNILFSKDYYEDKLFIKLGKEFKFISFDSEKVEIGAAYSLILAGNKLLNEGYSNFIYMNLIPGTFGGAVRQNAGTTNEGEIKDNFISARLYDLKKSSIITLDKSSMKFSYRNSIIQKNKNRYILLSATLSLEEKSDNVLELKEYIKNKIKNKKIKEPKGNSFGSTFKGLKDKTPAWQYIEKASLKGIVHGGAIVSNKHANWIINENNATGQEVLELINKIKNKVEKDFSIILEEEVEIF